MPDERESSVVLRWYGRILRLFPAGHRARFGDAMRQTFTDLYGERRAAGTATTGFLVWAFADIAAGVCRENISAMIPERKEFARAGLVTGGLLLAPLALTLANENAHVRGGSGGGWDWGPLDFVVMGGLLMIAALAVQWALRRVRKPAYRIVAVGAIVLVFVLVWVELAVDAVSRALGSLF